jgi:hypothetical protein
VDQAVVRVAAKREINRGPRFGAATNPANQLAGRPFLNFMASSTPNHPIAARSERADRGQPTGRPRASWRALSEGVYRYAFHPDPLAEASNWFAITIGTHLPFWPLYVWWSAGRQAFPTAVLTVALAPVFLMIPLLSRRSSILGRIAMPAAGIVNTVWTVWILGIASGTELFLMPCAAVAALLFRRSERWLMIVLTLLPLVVWYVLRDHGPAPLHHYGADAESRLFTLNAVSIGVLICLFGWFQVDIYQRMEQD